jgi:hypothetical protein
MKEAVKIRAAPNAFLSPNFALKRPFRHISGRALSWRRAD